MRSTHYPISQGELIRRARGAATQSHFARVLGVDRTCLSRYESESLGAPTSVINACLRAVADQMQGADRPPSKEAQALAYAREIVHLLELNPASREEVPLVSK